VREQHGKNSAAYEVFELGRGTENAADDRLWKNGTGPFDRPHIARLRKLAVRSDAISWIDACAGTAIPQQSAYVQAVVRGEPREIALQPVIAQVLERVGFA
jgi:hypothetical protein